MSYSALFKKRAFFCYDLFYENRLLLEDYGSFGDLESAVRHAFRLSRIFEHLHVKTDRSVKKWKRREQMERDKIPDRRNTVARDRLVSLALELAPQSPYLAEHFLYRAAEHIRRKAKK